MNKRIYRMIYLATKHPSWKTRKKNRKRILNLIDKLVSRDKLKESFNIVNILYKRFPSTYENDTFTAEALMRSVATRCQPKYHMLASILTDHFANMDLDDCKLVDVTEIKDSDLDSIFIPFPAPKFGPDPMVAITITGGSNEEKWSDFINELPS